MNPYFRFVIACLVIVAFLLPPGAEAARKGKELLEYIPADTPYVFAMTRPLPRNLQERFEPVVDTTLSAYRQIIDHHLAAELARLRQTEDGAARAARLQALGVELMALLSVEELRHAGLGKGSLFALYGDGLLPVLRLALTDAAAFNDAIGRVEAAASEQFEIGTLKGQSYRYRDFDSMRFIIGTFGKDAVITLVPVGHDDSRLAETLGLEKPRNSLARNNRLRSIVKEYGFTDHAIGLVDVQRLVHSVLSDPGSRNAEFLRVIGRDSVEISPTCRSEFEHLAGIAPRIVTGYTRVGKDGFDMSMTVELREDIAAGLVTLPALVPGLGGDLGGLVTFGFSLDPLALRRFYEARLDAMEADPFECEWLADLQGGVPRGREMLAQPVPPMVYSFRGFIANVTDIRGADLANDKPPEEVEGGVLFAVENAAALVTMAAMLSPEVAALNLLPDGKARLLNLPQLAELAQEAFAALSDSALAVAVGAGADRKAEAMLTATASPSRPFTSFSMDAKRYYQLMGDSLMQSQSGEEPLPAAVRSAVRDIMVSSAELYDRMAIDVHFTGRGIEISTRVALTD